jgi:hypothetical protein
MPVIVIVLMFLVALLLAVLAMLLAPLLGVGYALWNRESQSSRKIPFRLSTIPAIVRNKYATSSASLLISARQVWKKIETEVPFLEKKFPNSRIRFLLSPRWNEYSSSNK